MPECKPSLSPLVHNLTKPPVPDTVGSLHHLEIFLKTSITREADFYVAPSEQRKQAIARAVAENARGFDLWLPV